jgi:peptidoglycan-associated lipoprotein
MRSLLMVASLSLLTACATTTRNTAPPMGSALPVSSVAESDITGRWTGTWVGTGLFESPREDAVVLDIKQVGYAAYGRMVFDGSTAAESVPWEVRREGLSGARIAATVVGSQVRVKHELGSRYFAADLTRLGEDKMIGDVRGAAPGVQLLLTRASRRPDPPQAKVMPAPLPAAPEPAAAPEAPVVAEEPKEPDPVQIAAVLPSEEPQAPAAPERPRVDDYVPAVDLKTVYFDFDSAKLRADALDALATNAMWLKEHTDTQIMIEGHCDEVGTPEYNQALGDRRAESVKTTLAASGVETDRMATISYGKERPVCMENSEECRKLNRHVEFKIKSRDVAKTDDALKSGEAPTTDEAPTADEAPLGEGPTRD